MMNSDPFLDNLLHCLDLGQVLIILIEDVDGVLEDEIYLLFLVLCGEVVLSTDWLGIWLYVLFAETKDDHWVEVLFHDDLYDFEQVRALVGFLLVLLGIHADHVDGLAHHLHCLVEVLLVELALVIHHHVQSFSTRGAEVMLQRHRPVVRIHHVTGLLPELRDPGRELARVTDRGRQEDVSHVSRQHNDGFLPDHSSLLVPHVVHLIEYDPFYFSHDLAASVNHVPQDLGRHDQACRILVNRHIACNQTHIPELILQLSVLLIRQCLDRRSVDHSASVLQRKGYCVFSYGSLPRRGVCTD